MNTNHDLDYERQIQAEGKKWGDHLAVEASRETHAWLDHPTILSDYKKRGQIDGLPWKRWILGYLGRRAEFSLELGCGSGFQSVELFELGASSYIEGIDASEDRIRQAESLRLAARAPGQFQTGDVNQVELKPRRYDIVFSCHSFHHFLRLEHVMEEISRALTPEGVFVLEEFVGPSQFQWTEQQTELTRGLLSVVPEKLRLFRRGTLKVSEEPPAISDVVAESPFESIRSGEIVGLFERYFDVVARKELGGTIQHLLYNGIVHNFLPSDPESEGYIRSIGSVEHALIDGSLLPSDFVLLIGRGRRSSSQ